MDMPFPFNPFKRLKSILITFEKKIMAVFMFVLPIVWEVKKKTSATVMMESLPIVLEHQFMDKSNHLT